MLTKQNKNCHIFLILITDKCFDKNTKNRLNQNLDRIEKCLKLFKHFRLKKTARGDLDLNYFGLFCSNLDKANFQNIA